MVPIKKSAITKIAPIGTKKSVGSEKKKDTLVVIKDRCIEIDLFLKDLLRLIRLGQSNHERNQRRKNVLREKKN